MVLTNVATNSLTYDFNLNLHKYIHTSYNPKKYFRLEKQSLIYWYEWNCDLFNELHFFN